jgi:hypothetical protein
MAATLASCTAENDKRVACPGGDVAPKTYQLIIEPRGDGWRVTSFVQSE